MNHLPDTTYERVTYRDAAASAVFVCLDKIHDSRLTSPLHDLLAMKQLEAEARTAQTNAVDRARRDGVTWDVIALTLGVTRSAAIQRYKPETDNR